jgi:hypothetical protein
MLLSEQTGRNLLEALTGLSEKVPELTEDGSVPVDLNGVSGQAAKILPPIENTTYRYNVAATATKIAVPAAWVGKYVTLIAELASVYIVFGGSSVEADETATTGAKQCGVISIEHGEQWWIPDTVSNFSIKVAAGVTSAVLRAFVSST